MFWFLCNGDLEEIHAFEHWWKCKCFLYNFRNVIYMAWIYHTKTGLKRSINQCNVNRNYVRSLIIKSPTAMNFQSCEGISLLPYYWYVSISGTHLRATSGYTNIFMFFSILCLRRIDRDYISTINEMPVTRNVRN